MTNVRSVASLRYQAAQCRGYDFLRYTVTLMGDYPDDRTRELCRLASMADQLDEHMRQLCAQASVEQDSKKLVALVMEINQLFAERDKRTHLRRPKGHAS